MKNLLISAIMLFSISLYAESEYAVRIIIEENGATIERDYPVANDKMVFGDPIESRVYHNSDKRDSVIENPGVFCTGSVLRRGDVLHAKGTIVITSYKLIFNIGDFKDKWFPAKSVSRVSFDNDLVLNQKTPISGIMKLRNEMTPTLLNVIDKANAQYDARYYIMLIQARNSQGAQQVDSAEPSTIAVPPSQWHSL